MCRSQRVSAVAAFRSALASRASTRSAWRTIFPASTSAVLRLVRSICRGASSYPAASSAATVRVMMWSWGSQPVAAVRDVPSGDGPSPAPAVGLEDRGGSVALGCSFDDGSGLVRVRDGQHFGSLSHSFSCREGDWSPRGSDGRTCGEGSRPDAAEGFTARKQGDAPVGRAGWPASAGPFSVDAARVLRSLEVIAE